MQAIKVDRIADIYAVELDEEGFLKDVDAWSELFADNLAAYNNIHLDDEKRQLIYKMRTSYKLNGSILSLRKMCRDNEIDKQRVQNLFGSCLALWQLAGLPYPGEEARSYLS